MSLVLQPVIEGPRSRRRMRLDIEADIFLKLLQGLDGKRRIRTEGLPKDVRCIGLTVDSVFNSVSLYLESSDWDEVPPEYTTPQLTLTFREYHGSAQPED